MKAFIDGNDNKVKSYKFKLINGAILIVISLIFNLGLTSENNLYFITSEIIILFVVIRFILLLFEFLRLKIKLIKYSPLRRIIFYKIDIVIFGVILVSIFSGGVMLFTSSNTYNPDFGGLVGGVISGLATLMVIRITLTNEQNKSIEKARVSAGILSESISGIWRQINYMDINSRMKIIYLENWLDYYRDITYVTNNEYFSALNREFTYVERINKFIENGDKEKLSNILQAREEFNENDTNKYNISDVFLNLGMIKSGLKEMQSWEQRKENILSIENIEKKYYSIVSAKIYNILILKEKRQCSFKSIEHILIEMLRSYDDIKLIRENRIIIRALTHICCKINKDESIPISFVWNQLFLEVES